MNKMLFVLTGVIGFAAADASAQTWSVDPTNPLPERNRSIERALPATNQRTLAQDPMPIPRVGGYTAFLGGPVTNFEGSPFIVGSRRPEATDPQLAERAVEGKR